MKTKYLGMLAVGIIIGGSFSVFANDTGLINKANSVQVKYEPKETALEYKVSSMPNEIIETDRYSSIKKTIDEQLELGTLTEEEARQMLDYCVERMENSSDILGRRGCH